MKTTNKKISEISKALLFVAGVMLVFSIFVPIWRIDLDAPQYPEGLRLLIHANKLGGNVEIINGLNHYIGMKTLHTEDFIEFTVLPYLIGFFALLSFIAAFVARKRFLYFLFVLFVLFGVVAMVDFWRWEYNYGHDLDPNAAIIVPGMAYQPPLIGFKQLLNFGAYSVPSIGGWLFIISGVLMLLATIMEAKLFAKRKHKKTGAVATAAVLLLFMASCAETKPEPAKLNTDNCHYCKMTISDGRFVAELITAKGRIYKFDDITCMVNYQKENADNRDAKLFIANFERPEQFLQTDKAVFVKGDEISSPMGGNMAAFENQKAAEQFSEGRAVQNVLWNDIQQ